MKKRNMEMSSSLDGSGTRRMLRRYMSLFLCIGLMCLLQLTGRKGSCEYLFGPALRISPDTLDQFNPSIAVDSEGNPNVVWTALDTGIFFAKSTDGGRTFLPSVLVDTLAWGGCHPRIALDSEENPHLVWTSLQSSLVRARYTKSTDRGQTFLPSFCIDPDVGLYLDTGGIAVDGRGNPMITWTAAVDTDGYLVDKVFVVRSSDKGASFEPPVRVDPHAGLQGAPSIALDDTDNIYVSYLAGSWLFAGELFMARSTDGGATFSERVWVDRDSSRNWSSSITAVPRSPDPSTSDDDVMIVWNEYRGTTGVYFAKSTDGGVSFGEVVAVAENRYSDGFPMVAVDRAGDPIVVWLERQLYFSTSEDGGTVFSPPSPVEPEVAGFDDFLGVAMTESGIAMVVWDGVRLYHLPLHQIYFVKGTKTVGTEESPVDGGQRDSLALMQNSPNPFAGSTTIFYSISASRHITLWVYDSSGRLVRVLVEGDLPAGRHWVSWDGKGEFGHPLPSGMYFFKLQSEGASVTRKAILLR